MHLYPACSETPTALLQYNALQQDTTNRTNIGLSRQSCCADLIIVSGTGADMIIVPYGSSGCLTVRQWEIVFSMHFSWGFLRHACRARDYSHVCTSDMPPGMSSDSIKLLAKYPHNYQLCCGGGLPNYHQLRQNKLT